MLDSFVIICCKVNQVDFYLLLQRGFTAPSLPGKWSLPGGKPNPGETPAQTAIREVKEETNLNISYGLVQLHLQNVKANYFLSRLNNIPEIKLCWENIGYGWFNYEQVLKMEVEEWLTERPRIPSKIKQIQQIGL